MIETHAQAIADKLIEHAGKSDNFRSVVEFFVIDLPPITYTGTLYYHPRPEPLSWQGCPPYVLGAVLAIGSYLSVPEDVLMSDELLPAIARILRETHDQD